MQTQHNPAMRSWFDQLKRDIDLHDLAERLDLKRSGAKGTITARITPTAVPRCRSSITAVAGETGPKT